MPWCPQCAAEYVAGVTTCADCNVPLVESPPAPEGEPVVILEARSITEAQIAEATLEAEGIDAHVEDIQQLNPNVGVMGDDVPELDVVVAPEDAARAQAILSAPPLTEEELTRIEESEQPQASGDGIV